MPPRAQCQICIEKVSRYTCPCLVEYCSVACYKQHKETSCRETAVYKDAQPLSVDDQCPFGSSGDKVTKEVPLRPLTSLKWPYVPEESAYPDPLKRDDPKPLQTGQYEAIATSPAVRAALSAHPELKDVLRTIDGLRGSAREEAVLESLRLGRREEEFGDVGEGAMRGLAEAIEGAVRGRGALLGLDWE